MDRKYRVLFNIKGKLRQQDVWVIHNYTTESDIPKIIAIPAGVDATDIEVLSLKVVAERKVA